MLTLALAGDVMLGRGVDQALRTMPPAEPWGDVLPHLARADLRVINLECALTEHRRPWAGGLLKMFHFRAAPDAVRVLEAAHIDGCSLANNHTLDFEEQGLLDTLRTLRSAGIPLAGAGEDDAEAARPALLDAPGSAEPRVALLACTDNEPDFAARADRPGTNYLEVALDPRTLGRVEAGITEARALGAGLVVFSNHWGGNFVERPSHHFQEFARRVLDLGADVYYGHSAHICQGIEVHRGKAILYDTGDFIDDYAVDPVLRNDRSCLFTLRFEGRRLRRIELLPVKLTVAHVAVAQGRDREAIFSRMETLGAEFGTGFSRRGDHLVHDVA